MLRSIGRIEVEPPTWSSETTHSSKSWIRRSSSGSLSAFSSSPSKTSWRLVTPEKWSLKNSAETRIGSSSRKFLSTEVSTSTKVAPTPHRITNATTRAVATPRRR